MSSLMRSEKMAKCVMCLESDVSYDSMSGLGQLGTIQFLDMNKNLLAHGRKFTHEVRRCEEMGRKLRYFQKQVKEENLPSNDDIINPDAPPVSKMSEMETGFESMEKRLVELNDNLTVLINNKSKLVELGHILKNLTVVFHENIPERNNQPGQQDVGKLGFTAGVVALEKLMSLERLLWFACRGNALVKNVDIFEPIQDPATKAMVNKKVVYIFYQGEQLKSRVKKILEGFHANIYPCPETAQEAQSQYEGVIRKISDTDIVIAGSNAYKTRYLTEIAKKLPEWEVQVKKMKAIFHTLNMFSMDLTHKYLVGECWCPVVNLDLIKRSLQQIAEDHGSGSSSAILNRIDHGSEIPPTYNKTNKFTKVFQGIVNSYGIASYQEINPAPFIIITFPFLFSLMFGDAGHGAIIFLIALWMVLKESSFVDKKSDNEIWNIFFGGRYIILLMGAFSIYSGLIYNDVFSRPINIFGSSWSADPRLYDDYYLRANKEVLLNPNKFPNEYNGTDYSQYPFPFGMDPIWMISKNKITWLNSFKMKVSIIFGVFQMFFGVTLSFFNHKHFREPLNVFCELLPEMLFLVCMFGYLVLLIFYKWIAFDSSTSSCSPSLLINLINMFLYNYSKEPCSPTNFYPKQQEFQTALLLTVVVCIPWLLLPKPLILRHRNKKRLQMERNADNNCTAIEMTGQGSEQGENANDDATNNKDSHKNGPHPPSQKSGQGHGDEFDFGDIFIHQCIHTIEYCLGCISHTASYLRLWALSLAHAELSEVLWNMVLHNGFSLGASSQGFTPSIGCITLFIIWTPWAVLTVAILLLMEGLSAFLHTLRLHWVEFQSKFYKGEGVKFAPFSFRKILTHADD